MIDDSMLTEEQKRAIDAFAAWWKHGSEHGFGERPIWKLTGPAGSGKSTIANFAVEAAGIPSVLPLAFTGKAALVMKSKGLSEARTIHSAIYLPDEEVNDTIRKLRSEMMDVRMKSARRLDETPEDYALRKTADEARIAEIKGQITKIELSTSDRMNWILNPSGPMSLASLILVDEASMVGGRVQRDLESFGVPILYLGDSFQLPPIEDKSDKEFTSALFDRDGRPLTPDFGLTQIHRQAEGSAIIRHSRDIRLGLPEQHFRGKMVGDLGDMVLRVESSKLRIEHYAAAQQVICGKNDTRHAINAAIREFLGRSGPLPEDGDRVIILRNNKEHGLVNGMMGVALSGARSYNSKSGTIRFDCELEDGRQMVLEALEPYFSAPQNQDALYEKCPAWSRRDNQHVDYAWAITAHKCMTLDTIVHTDRGIMRISELDNGAARGEFKPLEGVSVETGTGLENAASFYNEGPAPVLRVETARGYSVRVTPGHRIFVLGENAELVERLAADVRPGDYVPIPRRTNGFGPDRQPLGYVDEGGYHNESYYTLPEFMSPYLAEFIGMVVADGSVTGRKVNYCKHEREPVARFAELANVLFGYRAKVVDRSKNGYAINDHMCEIHSTLIHRFMASFEGVLPDAKDVPKAILRSNKECQRMFLKGVAEDGTVNVRGGRFDHIEIEMKRESMFENVRAMLQNFGVLCSRYVDQKGYFRLMIYRESAVQFLREIGFHSPSKQANLLTAEIGDHSYSLEAFPHLGGAVKKLLKENRLNRQKVIRPPTLGDSATFNIVSRVIDQLPELAGQPLYDNLADILANYTFDKIVAVEADGVESTVCLEVPSTGAFVQNGILAGNSQGSQYTSGIVLYEPLGRTDELRRRWYYTAITRFEQNVIVAC